MPKVMVVDDEDVLLEMIVLLIEDLGYEAITAANGQDALAAAMAAAYVAPRERSRAVDALGSAPDASSSAIIGGLADSLLMRFGSYDMSLGMLAYYQEVCSAFGPWTALPDAGPLDAFFSGLHRPCASVPTAPDRMGGQIAPPRRSCVSRSVDDFVTPQVFTDQWIKKLPGAASLTLPGLPHAAPELAAACYRELTG